MRELLLRSKLTPAYIVISGGKVSEISIGFTELTSYMPSELKGKDLTYVFNLLQIKDFNSKLGFNYKEQVYLFTKYLEPHYVQIYYCAVPLENDAVYYFQEMLSL